MDFPTTVARSLFCWWIAEIFMMTFSVQVHFDTSHAANWRPLFLHEDVDCSGILWDSFAVGRSIVSLSRERCWERFSRYEILSNLIRPTYLCFPKKLVFAIFVYCLFILSLCEKSLHLLRTNCAIYTSLLRHKATHNTYCTWNWR